MSTYSNIPDFLERKGSLFMRSDHMNYSRATLNSNWHQAREAEPKEYDINRAPERDLCKATYKRIGNVTDGALPETTYQDFSQQIFNKKDDFTEKDPKKPMITAETITNSALERDTQTPKRGYGSVLPRHHSDYNKYHLETTHKTDYKPPFPYTPAEEKPKDFPDYSPAYKRCHSQFSDTADYRRNGRNTWQDESGVYSNTHLKTQAPVYQGANPILKAFQVEAGQ